MKRKKLKKPKRKKRSVRKRKEEKIFVNIKWHKFNKIPERPSFLQRLKWHMVHQWNCDCQDFQMKPKTMTKDKQMNPKALKIIFIFFLILLPLIFAS